MGLVREIFRKPITQNETLDSIKLVTENTTESADVSYTSVTVTSGVTWTIAEGVTVTVYGLTNNGTIVNNGTLVTGESGTDVKMAVAQGVAFFKGKGTPQNTMEDAPDV